MQSAFSTEYVRAKVIGQRACTRGASRTVSGPELGNQDMIVFLGDQKCHYDDDEFRERFQSSKHNAMLSTWLFNMLFMYQPLG